MNYDEWITQPYLESATEYEPVNWAPLEARIPGLVVKEAGGWVPYQAEGTLLGFPFYFRSRSENSRLHVYSVPEGDENRILMYSAESERLTSSHKSFAERMIELVPELWKARFMYQFENMDAHWRPEEGGIIEGTKRVLTSCDGHTPAEAYERFRERVMYFPWYDYPEGVGEKMWAARKVNPVPVNTDDRVFPDMLPDFRVLPA